MSKKGKGQGEQISQTFTCPICKKEFNGSTKYRCYGTYACSWECFLKRVKQAESSK